MQVERERFLDLLRGLKGDDWRRPTECPAYDVQGIAAHILGDDFSLLSRQRDAALPGVFRDMAEGIDFRTALDRFNDRWVDTAQFFSPSLLIELLEAAGHWTAHWYDAVDPAELGEPVGFFGATGPSPYWQISSREYVERFTHHHQILRALGRDGLDDDVVVSPAASVVVRAFAAHLDDLGASDGASIVVSVAHAAWTLVRAGDQWELFDGAAVAPTVTATIDRQRAATLLSRGVPYAGVTACLATTGDGDVAARLVKGISALAGR
jgi:uncharacterized protein (TIGR03083 family)